MKLYTTKIVAQYLDLSERRVRQLRDEGVLEEKAPGLYDLRSSVRRYINYLRGDEGGKADLNEERAKLTKEKRIAAETENKVRNGELYRKSDITVGMTTVVMNLRSRLLALPNKLAANIAKLDGDEGKIMDLLQSSLYEIMEEFSNYQVALQPPKDDEEDGTIEVAYEDRDGSVTDEICVVSNALYRMPVVGAMVCVLHNSDSQEMGTCIGTFWNEDNKPVGGKKQRYRYDYNDKKGKAFEQYDGDSGDYEEKIDGNAKETIGKNLDFTVGGDVTFKVGASTVKVCQSGTIEITGTTVKITGATVNISGGSGDCKINGVSLVNHKHEHDGSAKAGPYGD